MTNSEANPQLPIGNLQSLGFESCESPTVRERSKPLGHFFFLSCTRADHLFIRSLGTTAAHTGSDCCDHFAGLPLTPSCPRPFKSIVYHRHFQVHMLMFSHSNLELSERAPRAGALYSVVETPTPSPFFFLFCVPQTALGCYLDGVDTAQYGTTEMLLFW